MQVLRKYIACKEYSTSLPSLMSLVFLKLRNVVMSMQTVGQCDVYNRYDNIIEHVFRLITYKRKMKFLE